MIPDIFQNEVIHSNGNLLVIAGPGSGKTRTILSKIDYLVSKGYEKDILVLSFTNKSVLDIKEKLGYDVFVTTFHKLAMDILDYNHVNYSICNTYELDYIINEYFYRMNNKDKNKLCNYLNIAKINSKEFESLKRLIKTFINLFKTNNKNIDDIYNLVNNYKDKCLIKIILDIFYLYEEEKHSTYNLDFDDLIIEATKILKNNYNYKKFKYIIIDEFQDTSMIRLELIKEIYKNSNSIITAVGDDAQSIFHFSGCDLNIFLNFNKYFPSTKIFYLKHTYRNSQNLVDISEYFINKNKYQLVKNMKSKCDNNNPIIIKKYFNSKKILTKVLDEIDNEDVLIISRNTKDIYKYLNNKISYKDGIISYKNYSYKYMTIHSSKGLEASYVVILNVSDDTLGLPNKIENHPILKYVNGSIDNYPYAEERRVFFVAITRCKKKTYLLVPYPNPSPFIKEIKKMLFKHL